MKKTLPPTKRQLEVEEGRPGGAGEEKEGRPEEWLGGARKKEASFKEGKRCRNVQTGEKKKS